MKAFNGSYSDFTLSAINKKLEIYEQNISKIDSKFKVYYFKLDNRLENFELSF